MKNEYIELKGDTLWIKNPDTSHMMIPPAAKIMVNGRELSEVESFEWFQAAIDEKAAREMKDNEVQKYYESKDVEQHGIWRGYNTQDEYKEALAIITFELYLMICKKGMPTDLQYIHKINDGSSLDPFRQVYCEYQHTVGWKAFFKKGEPYGVQPFFNKWTPEMQAELDKEQGREITFAGRLRHLMSEAGRLRAGKTNELLGRWKPITAYALSKETGISQSSISEWLSKNYNPSVENLFTLSKRFSVSVGYLLGVED